MKTIVLTFLLAVVALLGSCGMTKNGEPVKQKVTIQTNAQCGDCRERIEGELNFTKGIIFAELNLETKEVTIKYNSKKITPDEIRQKIAEIGYAADDVKPVKEAQAELPKCCQPGGHD